MSVLEAASANSTRHQPGDDLDHICATHSSADDLTSACKARVGCRSYCGIDLSTDGWEWAGDDPDTPVTPNDCVVCDTMWQAEA